MMISKKLLNLPLGFYLIIVVVLSGCAFSTGPVHTIADAKKHPLDVIIVPGMPYDSMDTPSLMKMRMHWAKILYDSGVTKHIIFSGSSVYTPYKEGEIMKIMADSMGIPAHCTFAETKAEHSTENLYYSWKMAKDLGFKRIAVATDQFQMVMLKRIQRKYCKEVLLMPVGLKADEFDDKFLPEINPSSAYVENFVSLKDRENFWQRMRGTLGKRVKEEARADANSEEPLDTPTSSTKSELIEAN